MLRNARPHFDVVLDHRTQLRDLSQYLVGDDILQDAPAHRGSSKALSSARRTSPRSTSRIEGAHIPQLICTGMHAHAEMRSSEFFCTLLIYMHPYLLYVSSFLHSEQMCRPCPISCIIGFFVLILLVHQ